MTVVSGPITAKTTVLAMVIARIVLAHSGKRSPTTGAMPMATPV